MTALDLKAEISDHLDYLQEAASVEKEHENSGYAVRSFSLEADSTSTDTEDLFTKFEREGASLEIFSMYDGIIKQSDPHHDYSRDKDPEEMSLREKAAWERSDRKIREIAEKGQSPFREGSIKLPVKISDKDESISLFKKAIDAVEDKGFQTYNQRVWAENKKSHSNSRELLEENIDLNFSFSIKGYKDNQARPFCSTRVHYDKAQDAFEIDSEIVYEHLSEEMDEEQLETFQNDDGAYTADRWAATVENALNSRGLDTTRK